MKMKKRKCVNKYHMYQTLPSFTYESFMRFIIFIESSNNTNRHIISAIVKMIFYFGLKSNEVISMNTEDIIVENGHISKVSVDQLILLISDKKDIVNFLHQYLFYLSEIYDRKTFESLPLFPNSKHERFNRKDLAKQIHVYAKNFPEKFTIESIRWAGICHFYKQLRKEGIGIDMRDVFNKTENFFRCSEVQLDAILEGKHKIKDKNKYEE